MASRGADKRRDKRLELTLPVKFSVKPEDDLAALDGVTHNVSSGGLYFEAPAEQVTPTDPLWLRHRPSGRATASGPRGGLVARSPSATRDLRYSATVPTAPHDPASVL